jgi:hypothetical protein
VAAVAVAAADRAGKAADALAFVAARLPGGYSARAAAGKCRQRFARRCSSLLPVYRLNGCLGRQLALAPFHGSLTFRVYVLDQGVLIARRREEGFSDSDACLGIVFPS